MPDQACVCGMSVWRNLPHCQIPGIFSAWNLHYISIFYYCSFLDYVSISGREHNLLIKTVNYHVSNATLIKIIIISMQYTHIACSRHRKFLAT